MRKLCILSILLVTGLGLFAQESASLEELRLFSRSAILKAEQQARIKDADSVVLGDFLYEGMTTPLGRLMADLLTAGLTNSSTLNVIMNPGLLRSEGTNWLTIQGVVHKVDDVIYMQLKVLDGLTSNPLAVVEKTTNYGPMAELLTVESYDDYYDTPMVSEDYFMEPNDDPYSSVEYTLEDNYELALTRGDADWFYFNVTEDEITDDALMVEIYTTGDTDTLMTVYGPDDSDLYMGESDDYIDSNAGMVLTITEPGTYWVVVSGYSDDTSGYYHLVSETSPVAFADEYEPNNTHDNATPLSVGDEQDHAFAAGDSLDVFQFTLDSSEEVVLYTESNMDTYMDLYDEFGNYVASDDDGGKDSNARLQVDLNRGTYFLEVRPYDEGTSGSYRLIYTYE